MAIGFNSDTINGLYLPGNIIQVINSENDYTHTITNNANWNSDLLSAVGTTWEIAITPKYNNSKIIIQLLQNGYISRLSDSAYFGMSIWRKIGAGAYSQIQTPQVDSNGSYEFGMGFTGISTFAFYSAFSKLYVDSPNSTNEIKYKFSIRTYYTNTSFTANINATPTKGKSFCVLQEVQQ